MDFGQFIRCSHPCFSSPGEAKGNSFTSLLISLVLEIIYCPTIVLLLSHFLIWQKYKKILWQQYSCLSYLYSCRAFQNVSQLILCVVHRHMRPVFMCLCKLFLCLNICFYQLSIHQFSVPCMPSNVDQIS